MNTVHNLFYTACKNMPSEPQEKLLDDIANSKGITFFQAAVEVGRTDLMNSRNKFPKIDMDYLFAESGFTSCLLHKIFEKEKFGKMVSSVADFLYFPRNSTMLHALSCLASALVVKRYTYRADHWVGPVNLYTMVVQPPSTAKSSINNRFCDVIHEYVKGELTDEIKVKRKEISIDIALKSKQMKMAADREAVSIELDIEELQEELSTMALPVYKVTDATPEALQVQSAKQGNWWCLNTAEQGLISKVFGLGYGSSKNADLDFILQSWGYEDSVVLRITRPTVSTKSVGNIGMVIQNAGADSLLKIGENGQGLPERFFMMKERSNLGTRNKMERPDYPVDNINWYEDMVKEILHGESNVELNFSHKCIHMVDEQMQDYEPHMGEGGKYSSTLLQGMIGKADAQIYRLASIIHVFRSYKKGKKMPREVTEKTMFDAIAAYEQLKESNIQVTTSTGYAGESALKKAIIEALQDLHERKKLVNGNRITLGKFRDLKKGGKPFNGYERITMVLRQTCESLAKDGVIAFHDDEIWINPNILN